MLVRMRAAPSWGCEVKMEDSQVIHIPQVLTEPLLRLAAEKELPLEDILESAFRIIVEGRPDNAQH